MGGRRFVEGLYQALFSFSLAHQNVIYKAKRKINTTEHYYPATLFKLYLSLSLLFYGSSSVQMLLIPIHMLVHTNSSPFNWLLDGLELQTSIRQGCLSGSLIRVYKSRNLVGLEFHNLRSGWILAVLIHSPWRLPLKLGLKQTLTSLYSLRPDFGRNADWLLEQCHRIWLAVGINGSWKSLFLAWFFSRMISHGQREGSILLSFLFYGLIANEPSERRRSNGEAAAE